jgi:hypothetical protein
LHPYYPHPRALRVGVQVRAPVVQQTTQPEWDLGLPP